jgi:hypothetical protein
LIPLSGQPSAPGFSRLGEPLNEAECDHALVYLDALSLRDMDVTPARSWQEAQAIACDAGWDRRWWMREEEERERLYAECILHLGREATLARLSAATAAVIHLLHETAVDTAARDGVCNEDLARAASGAASLALHAAALARLAGERGDHAFVRKYALFECGRWPLAIVRNRFYIF